ncbi:MAG: 23S rRNA (uracil(1939)-C(5))-methyltransferase RlmD [Clostridia bacterium]|nr:23S rRNA (uracil(1939)-C(5))-methyltransferase RlmD [Clostridia bacterium]
MKKNDEIKFTITTLTSQGSGLGRFKDMAVFVEGAAPGDELLVHIIKVKKNYAVGKIKKIVKKAKCRIESDCEIDTRCGGCAYRHISYEEELNIKKQTVTDALQRIGGLGIEVKEILSIKEPKNYRNKAQIPVGMSEDGNIQIGFYSKRTHRITDSDRCLLQKEDFHTVIPLIRRYIAENPVTIYDEKTGKGLLRHIYLRQAHKTGEMMVCLVINGDSIPRKERLIELLLSSGKNIRSIVLNINKKDTNVILGDECITIWGSDFIEDELCGLKFRISPLSFYQVNPEGTELLYGKAKEYAGLTGNEVILDLYCGAGTIGLTMADKAKSLIGVEIIPQAIENAKENAKLNNIENARFICDDAKGAAKTLYDEGIRPDVVVLDPPRKGCSREVLETVSSMSPETVVYVSCDPATLARDLAVFNELGYETKEATAVDMFPRTTHVETVVLLSQRRPDTHIDIKLDLSEIDITAAETKATYQEIKDYVLDKFGLKVSTLYISQVKAKCGIIERENYNKGKEGHRVPKCPKEKEDAIMDALRHFRMVQ